MSLRKRLQDGGQALDSEYRRLHTWGSSSQLSTWYQGLYLKQTAEKRNQPPIPV